MIENINPNISAPPIQDSSNQRLHNTIRKVVGSKSHVRAIYNLLIDHFPAIQLGDKLGEGSFSTAYSFTFQERDGRRETHVLKLARYRKCVEEVTCNRLDEERMGGEWMALLKYAPSVLQTYHAIAYDRIERRVILIDARDVQLMFHESERRRGKELILIGTVSEYVEGSKSLMEVLDQKGALDTLPTIRNLARQLFEGIASIHAKSHGDRSLIHRDIKPANVLITENGDLKVIDFGFARLAEHAVKRLSRCGAPSYAAPELIKSGDYNFKAESYSLASTLSMMATGKAHVTNFNDLGTAILNNHNLLHEHIDKFEEMDPLLKDLITRLGEMDPEKRPSVEEALSHPFFEKAVGTSGCEALEGA